MYRAGCSGALAHRWANSKAIFRISTFTAAVSAAIYLYRRDRWNASWFRGRFCLRLKGPLVKPNTPPWNVPHSIRLHAHVCATHAQEEERKAIRIVFSIRHFQRHARSIIQKFNHQILELYAPMFPFFLRDNVKIIQNASRPAFINCHCVTTVKSLSWRIYRARLFAARTKDFGQIQYRTGIYIGQIYRIELSFAIAEGFA